MQTYVATNTLNGKFYIGSTFDLDRRKTEHLRCKNNYPFQNALRKNPEAFEWEAWEDDSDDPILEQALLDTWFGCGQCYNLNPSAKHPPRQDGIPRTPEVLVRISEGNKRMWQDPEYKNRVNKSKVGRKHTQDSKDKSGDTLSALWGNEWVVLGPDDTEYVITNLRRFCREHHLSRSCMQNLVKQQNGQKTHRGFRLKQ